LGHFSDYPLFHADTYRVGAAHRWHLDNKAAKMMTDAAFPDNPDRWIWIFVGLLTALPS